MILELSTIFILSVTLLSAIVLFLAVSVTYKDRTVASFLAPISMALIVIMSYTIDDIKSRPIAGYPPAGFTMVHYTSDGDIIHLWAYADGKNYPQTWVFEYNEEEDKQLREAQKDAREGVRVRMKKKGDANSRKGFERILGSPESPDAGTRHLKNYLNEAPEADPTE